MFVSFSFCGLVLPSGFAAFGGDVFVAAPQQDLFFHEGHRRPRLRNVGRRPPTDMGSHVHAGMLMFSKQLNVQIQPRTTRKRCNIKDQMLNLRNVSKDGFCMTVLVCGWQRCTGPAAAGAGAAAADADSAATGVGVYCCTNNRSQSAGNIAVSVSLGDVSHLILCSSTVIGTQ